MPSSTGTADNAQRSLSTTRTGAPATSLWQRTWFAPALIAALGLLVYANSFSTPFVFDGVHFILENPTVRTLRFWDYQSGGNRPIGFLTFGINYALDGYEVWGYHAVNLAVHLMAAWVLFALVRDTLSLGKLRARYGAVARGLALAVAVIWLVHPLQTQSVTYIYQRLESLMALFYLLTLYGFVRAQIARRPTAWYVLSVACCALGMATKEVMVTAPLAIIWYDRAFVANSWRELLSRRFKYYLALAACWGILAAVMLPRWSEYPSDGVLFVENVSPLDYALSQPGVILHYLGLAFWPDRLCLDYAWPVARTARDILPPLIAIGVLGLLTIWGMIFRPALGFVAGSFFLVLAPTSSIAPIKDLAFEHRMYLPLASLIVLTVVAGYELWVRAIGSRSSENVVAPAAVVAIAVVLLGCRTLMRNEDYSSSLTIWRDAAEKAPESRVAHYNVGTELLAAGDLPGAIAEFDLAIEAKNGLASTTHSAYINRATSYERLGDYARAIEDYSRAIELHPDNLAYYDRGQAYLKSRQYEQAVRDYTRAIELSPQFAQAYNNRGGCYQILKRYAEAKPDFDKAIELEPNFADAYNNRAMSYFLAGDYSRAWDDVHTFQRLGGAPNPRFLRKLGAASGRDQ